MREPRTSAFCKMESELSDVGVLDVAHTPALQLVVF